VDAQAHKTMQARAQGTCGCTGARRGAGQGACPTHSQRAGGAAERGGPGGCLGYKPRMSAV